MFERIYTFQLFSVKSNRTNLNTYKIKKKEYKHFKLKEEETQILM